MTTTPRRIDLRSTDIRLEVLSTGAAVRQLVVTGADGSETGVVLGHRDVDAYAAVGGYFGVVVGRVANRIDAGRFSLDGVEYEVPTNDRGNALHGGPDGYDLREWDVESTAPDAVTLSLTSPHGDQGFPGELRVSVTYTVSPGEVAIDYLGTTTRPTVVNLTNHSYFNLDGEGRGTIDDHVLQVHADATTPVRPDMIPTGEVTPVDGTPFDLRRPRRLSDVLAEPSEQLGHASGLDHNFVLSGSGLRTAARLTGRSGLELEVLTDRPGVQVYSGAYFDGSVVGPSGARYTERAGIALETQGFPDAPNQPRFPSVVLRPEETFSSRTVWRLRHTG
jgi:aldose 1-epimerase